MNTSKKQGLRTSRRDFLAKTLATSLTVGGLALAKPFSIFGAEPTEISEAEAIHRMVTTLSLPEFPIDGAIVDTTQRRFLGIQTLEYQQQSGLSLIDSPEELGKLADGIATVYFPPTVDPNAFEKLAQISGVDSQFARRLKNGQQISNLDVLAQFSFNYFRFSRTNKTDWLSYRGSDGRVMVTGSEKSIVDIKSEGSNRRPRGEARPLRDFLEALGGFLGGKGFETANYNQNDINRIPKGGANYLEETSGNVQLPAHIEGLRYSPRVRVPLSDAKSVVGRYGNFPSQDINLHWINIQNGCAEVRDLNTSGPMNGFVHELMGLEERLAVPVERRNRLTLGGPDRNMISSQSQDNQASTKSGLLSIDSYSSVPNNNFFIQITEKTGVSHLKNKADYHVAVAFGQEALRVVMNKRDRLFMLGALENAGLGFAFGGPWGAAIMGGKSIFDGIWAYFEGKNPPKSSIMSDDRHYVSGLEPKVSDVVSILTNSQRVGATDLIVFNYNNNICVNQRPANNSPMCRQVSIQQPGVYSVGNGRMVFNKAGVYNVPQACTPAACAPAEILPPSCGPVAPNTQRISMPAVGVIYARDAYNVNMNCNCVTFDTSLCGANHLLGLLYTGIMESSFNLHFHHHENHGHQGVTGGRQGAPMGDGFHGVTGGNPGGPMGDGYHGVTGGNPSNAMGNGYRGSVMGGR